MKSKYLKNATSVFNFLMLISSLSEKAKMFFLILICFVMFYLPVYSQAQGSYSYIPSDKDTNKDFLFGSDDIFYYGVDIDLKEQRYLITIGLYPESDSHFIKLISHGKCMIKDNIIIMYDHIHDIQMSAQLKNGTLSFMHCFPFLKNKHFSSIGYFDDTFDYHIETKSNLSIVREQKVNFAGSLDRLFLDGYYKTIGDDYWLCIEESSYTFFYKGVLLSEGKLAKGRINEIILVDTSLNTTFSIWLDGKSLNSHCVPGCYKGVAFRKVK